MNDLFSVFQEDATQRKLKGVMGITAFEPAYKTLHPIQKKKLEKICGIQFETLIKNGYFITISYAYPDSVIRSIAKEKGAAYDKDAWNIYAEWYSRLNNALNETVAKLIMSKITMVWLFLTEFLLCILE
jgi:hypothetical protein